MLLATLLLSAVATIAQAGPSTQSSTTTTSTTRGCKDASHMHTKVLILGGGMSGIVAARTLANDLNITDFLVVEGRDEIGGRMQNVPFGKNNEYSVEFGANWIQGLGTNPIWGLAQKYNVANIFSNWSNIDYFGTSGWEGNDGAVAKAFERFDGPVFDFYSELAHKGNASGHADMDMRSALNRVGWKGQTPEEWAAEYWYFDWEQAEAPAASSFYHFQQSYDANFVEFGDDSNNLAIDKRGFKTIITGQAAEIKDFDKKILLNGVVDTVEYSESGVIANLKDGRVIHADYGLVTFSAGVLQHDDVKFEPKFPQWKSDAISSLHMATYTKIFAQFPYKFWNDTQFMVYADPKERGYYTPWQSLDVEGFLPGSRIFFATLTSEQAHRAENQTDEEVKADFMGVLRKMYGPDIPDPIDFKFPRWTQDPLFRGTFSNWGAGVSDESMKNVRAPLGCANGDGTTTDRLFFGGEHTSAKYFGYLQGAYFSGLVNAHHIADCINNNCEQSTTTAQIVRQIEEPMVDYPTTKLGRHSGRRW